MWRHLFVFSALTSAILVYCVTDKIIGKGKWLVENISKCPESEQYTINFDLKKKKVNRTHDGFDVQMDLGMDVTYDNLGVYVEMCKRVDGGCKQFHVFEDDSFCKIVMKYAADNFKKLLNGAGVNPDCPIFKGHYQINDYTFDYAELPEEGMLGEFMVQAYAIKDGERVSCVIVDVVFEYVEEEEEDDESE